MSQTFSEAFFEGLTSCPTIDELALVIRSTEQVTPDLIAHIETCTDCQEKLDHLTAGSNLVKNGSLQDAPATLPAASGPVQRFNELGIIDDLTIDEFIASGGMGEVFRGREVSLNRTVAVKIMRNGLSARSAERFQRESRAAARLQHDHIVSIYRTGTTSKGLPFILFPLIQGGSLRERLLESQLNQSQLLPRESAQIAFEIAGALAAAHAVGMVHRDVKPANILLDIQDGRAKLTDFGLVHSDEEETLTQVDVICGTPEYMSPEQTNRQSELDGRSDIYSLGITLYECLTGRVPYRGHPLDVLEQHRSADPIPPTRLNREVPRDLETVCLRAMARDRERRYATADAFRDDLARHLAGQPVLARPVGGLERGWMWCRRNKPMAALLGLLFLSLVGGLATTSALWYRSSINARTAINLAGELGASRERMRESVQRFQNQIFSSESLHWQMSSQFRATMFGELIDFLDEFASQEPVGAAIGTEDPEVVQTAIELTESYLGIAESGSEAGQWREATIAAERALQRARLRTSAANITSSNWLHQARSAQLLAEIMRAKSGMNAMGTSSSLYKEAVEAAARAVDSNSESLDVWLFSIDTRLAAIRGRGFDNDPNETSKLVRDISNELLAMPIDETDYIIVAKVERLKAQAYLLMIGQQATDQLSELVAKADRAARKYREGLRSQAVPLVASDWLRGEIRLAEARRWKELGDSESAMTAVELAVEHMAEAIARFPQNRRWRMSLASVHSLSADWLLEEPDFNAARSHINEAIKCLVHVLETDAADHHCRVQVIDQLLRYGEISARLDDPDGAWRGYHTAAEDCKLLWAASNPFRDWAIETRIWALSTGLPWLEKSTFRSSSFDKKKWIESVLTEAQRAGVADHQDRYRSILAGELVAVRPEPPLID